MRQVFRSLYEVERLAAQPSKKDFTGVFFKSIELIYETYDPVYAEKDPKHGCAAALAAHSILGYLRAAD
jgi:hypothetical protein